jgi:2-polyprenyl-6-hydroxyphenyl methylase/3-demethylubiquinone-9 3-methyltransferase
MGVVGNSGGKKFFYERFAGEFDERMDRYDLTRRLEIVFGELLGGEALAGRLFLDAGCGTGHFSRRAAKRGAEVVSLDVGPALLAKVAGKCSSHPVIGDVLSLAFADRSFDFVLSTEVIEHTVDPEAAVRELVRVLKPGGTLVLTVPNRFWHFSVSLANALKIRPYEGYENWMGWSRLRERLWKEGLTVKEMRGFHLFPFVLRSTHGLLRRLDRYGARLGPFMVNIAVRAVHKPPPR